MHGKNWNQIQRFIGTRTCPQTRSHAQKFFRKMQKSGLLKVNSSMGEDSEGHSSDSSEEEKKRSPRGGRRSRLNSIKSEKMKEKMQN